MPSLIPLINDQEPIPTFTLKLTSTVISANPSLWNSFKRLKAHELMLTILSDESYSKLNVHLLSLIRRLIKSPDECSEEVNTLFDEKLPEKISAMLKFAQSNQQKNMVEMVLELTEGLLESAYKGRYSDKDHLKRVHEMGWVVYEMAWNLLNSD